MCSQCVNKESKMRKDSTETFIFIVEEKTFSFLSFLYGKGKQKRNIKVDFLFFR